MRDPRNDRRDAVLAALIALVGIILIFCCGCGPLGECRRAAVGYSIEQTAAARRELGNVAEAAKDLVAEVVTARKEERPPDLAPPVRELAGAIERAGEHVEETGRTLGVVQKDVGTPLPSRPVPKDKDDAVALRVQYESAIRIAAMLKAALTWAKSRLPLGGLGVPPSTGPPGNPWTPGQTGGVLATILALVGTAAEVGRRHVVKLRVERAAAAGTEEQLERKELALDQMMDLAGAKIKKSVLAEATAGTVVQEEYRELRARREAKII